MAQDKKEQALKESIKRVLVYQQLLRYSLMEIKQSDTVKEWTKKAKENGNNAFLDIRIPSGELLRSLDAYLIKLKGNGQKGAIGPETMKAILSNLNGESVHEMNILVERTADMRPEEIAEINRLLEIGSQQYKEQKRKENGEG